MWSSSVAPRNFFGVYYYVTIKVVWLTGTPKSACLISTVGTGLRLDHELAAHLGVVSKLLSLIFLS